MKKLRLRLAGLLFFVIIIGLIALSIAIFQGRFTETSTIKLRTSSAGNALNRFADVKSRGVQIGEVQSIEPAGPNEVIVELALEPSALKDLPRDTTARILPKTLFGERYISLQVPTGPVTDPLRSGDVIDTSAQGHADEVEDLFDALLPVLEAVPPQHLNSTLTAIAQAIGDRGTDLKQTVAQLEMIFSRLDEEQNIENLEGTLEGLASFSTTYSEALPDIIDGLDTLRTTTNTLVEREMDLSSLIATLSVAADDTSAFLRDNKQNLLDLTIKSEPFLTRIAAQSPSFGCTFHNFATIIPKSGPIVGEGSDNPGVRVNVQFVNPRGRYLPNQDEPRIFWTDPPARCFEPATNGRPFGQYPGGSIPDGSYQPPSRNPGPAHIPHLAQPQFTVTPSGVVSDQTYADQVKVVYAADAGTDPAQVPTWITYITGPSLKGAEVTIE